MPAYEVNVGDWCSDVSSSEHGLYRASVPVQYSYTSTPPMDRTAYTEPQCLYKGALYLFYICDRRPSLEL
jgi:hypothetical protein